VCVSEFVRVTRDPAPAAVLRRDVPELMTGGRTAAGVPVFVQLLGGDAEPVARTAQVAASLGAPGIDLNFGCPAKTVNNHDGGATLLKYPERIRRIVARTRELVPHEIPVTMKMRVGWDSAEGIEAIAEAAEAGGAAWITIHARTRSQLYRPPVVWDALARARAAVRIPVVANGDVCVANDVHACAAESCCEAFMIGRGAMARPSVFAAIRRDDAAETGRGAGQARGAPRPVSRVARVGRCYARESAGPREAMAANGRRDRPDAGAAVRPRQRSSGVGGGPTVAATRRWRRSS
jgi:tRNA-dihydrouridine synthase C